jgi:hypothetical protein
MFTRYLPPGQIVPIPRAVAIGNEFCAATRK